MIGWWCIFPVSNTNKRRLATRESRANLPKRNLEMKKLLTAIAACAADAHDVGAHIREQHRSERDGPRRIELDDSDPRQRTVNAIDHASSPIADSRTLASPGAFR